MTDNTFDEEFQELHYLLLKEYFDLVKTISNLDFFVNIWEFRDKEKAQNMWEKISKFKLISKFLKILGNMLVFLFRPFCLRPILKLYVESHIQRKLNELGAAYTQELFLLSEKDKPQWVREYVESYSTLSNTLTSWVSIKGFFTSIIALVVAIYGAQNIGEFIQLAVEAIRGVSWLQLSPENIVSLIRPYVTFSLYYLPLIAVFFIISFFFKRLLFKKQGSNIYAIEDKIFQKLGREKRKEVAIDYLLFALLFSFLPLLIIVFIMWIGFSREPLVSFQDYLKAIYLLYPYFLPLLLIIIFTIRSNMLREFR